MLVGAGVDLDAVNEYGQTALYIASWRGFTSLVNLFLTARADPTICATCGSSPADVALLGSYTRIIALLGQAGSPTHTSRGQELNLAGTAYALTKLIKQDAEHPGAGAATVDSLGPHAVEQLIQLWKTLPVNPGRISATCGSHRSYFCDVQGAVRRAIGTLVDSSRISEYKCVVLPHMRFLHYDTVGGYLAPHIDLSRVDASSGVRSTHTILLYLTSVGEGGETALLQCVNQEESDQVLAVVKPQPGRLLVFPHACPHEGRLVQDVPKLLVRGELYFSQELIGPEQLEDARKLSEPSCEEIKESSCAPRAWGMLAERSMRVLLGVSTVVALAGIGVWQFSKKHR